MCKIVDGGDYWMYRRLPTNRRHLMGPSRKGNPPLREIISNPNRQLLHFSIIYKRISIYAKRWNPSDSGINAHRDSLRRALWYIFASESQVQGDFHLFHLKYVDFKTGQSLTRAYRAGLPGLLGRPWRRTQDKCRKLNRWQKREKKWVGKGKNV